MSPDTITIASQWTDGVRVNTPKVTCDYSEFTITETAKEKLLRKKKERMNSLPEKTKRKIGKWRF